MKYWKIGNRDDSLFIYAAADTQQRAVSMAEELTGPIAPQRRIVREIAREQVPENMIVLGEEEPAEEDEA